MSAIHTLCEGGKATSLRLVLPYVTVEDADVLSRHHQRTPLQFTFALRGHKTLQCSDTSSYIECVRLLLEKGVNTSPDPSDLQPLHMACQLGCVETVKLLLNAPVPAKVNTVSVLGSPLHILRTKVSTYVGKYDLLSPFMLPSEGGASTQNYYHRHVSDDGLGYTLWNGGRYSKCIELVIAAGGKDRASPSYLDTVLNCEPRLVSSYA